MGLFIDADVCDKIGFHQPLFGQHDFELVVRNELKFAVYIFGQEIKLFQARYNFVQAEKQQQIPGQRRRLFVGSLINNGAKAVGKAAQHCDNILTDLRESAQTQCEQVISDVSNAVESQCHDIINSEETGLCEKMPHTIAQWANKKCKTFPNNVIDYMQDKCARALRSDGSVWPDLSSQCKPLLSKLLKTTVSTCTQTVRDVVESGVSQCHELASQGRAMCTNLVKDKPKWLEQCHDPITTMLGLDIASNPCTDLLVDGLNNLLGNDYFDIGDSGQIMTKLSKEEEVAAEFAGVCPGEWTAQFQPTPSFRRGDTWPRLQFDGKTLAVLTEDDWYFYVHGGLSRRAGKMKLYGATSGLSNVAGVSVLGPNSQNVPFVGPLCEGYYQLHQSGDELFELIPTKGTKKKCQTRCVFTQTGRAAFHIKFNTPGRVTSPKTQSLFRTGVHLTKSRNSPRTTSICASDTASSCQRSHIALARMCTMLVGLIGKRQVSKMCSRDVLVVAHLRETNVTEPFCLCDVVVAASQSHRNFRC